MKNIYSNNGIMCMMRSDMGMMPMPLLLHAGVFSIQSDKQ